MRIAFMSDIHGNILALEAAYRSIKQKGAEKIYCAGDLVPFGPRPAEVVDFFINHDIETVLGNHDATIIGKENIDSYIFKNDEERSYITDSIQRTSKDLTQSHFDYLNALPEKIEASDRSLLLVHSVPDMCSYPDEKIISEYMKDSKYRFLFFGHSHTPRLYAMDNKKIAVSIPSIGKPKHGDPFAGYCIVEIENEHLYDLQFTFCEYDIDVVCREITQRGFPQQTLKFLKYN